jgi:phosphoribosyl 1,2-cyclic phosphodiesterase
MILKFLGTRGEIEARSKLHGMHSSLLIVHASHKVMIDCGSDWAERLRGLRPEAIVLTHAHSDHAGGLKSGSPCPVFATASTWELLKRCPIGSRRMISPFETFEIGQVAFEAFPVEHSLRAPAVGYRVQCSGACLVYVPDVASIPDAPRVFAGVDIYIGDGASLMRPLLRKRGDALIGHAPIATQLKWCQAATVHRAIFTHCGSQIVAGDEQEASLKVRELGERHGIQASLAYDGLRITLDRTPS